MFRILYGQFVVKEISISKNLCLVSHELFRVLKSLKDDKSLACYFFPDAHIHAFMQAHTQTHREEDLVMAEKTGLWSPFIASFQSSNT